MPNSEHYFKHPSPELDHRRLADEFAALVVNLDEYALGHGGDRNLLNSKHFDGKPGSKFGYTVNARDEDDPDKGDANNQRVFHYGLKTTELFERILGDDCIEGLDEFLMNAGSAFNEAQIVGKAFMQKTYPPAQADLIIQAIWPEDASKDKNVLRVVLFEGNNNGYTIEPHYDHGIWTAAFGESGKGLVIEGEYVERPSDFAVMFAGSQLAKWVDYCPEAQPNVFNQKKARHYSVETEERYSDAFARYAVIGFFDPNSDIVLPFGGYKEAYGRDYRNDS